MSLYLKCIPIHIQWFLQNFDNIYTKKGYCTLTRNYISFQLLWVHTVILSKYIISLCIPLLHMSLNRDIYGMPHPSDKESWYLCHTGNTGGSGLSSSITRWIKWFSFTNLTYIIFLSAGGAECRGKNVSDWTRE